MKPPQIINEEYCEQGKNKAKDFTGQRFVYAWEREAEEAKL